jgi:predicted NAD/FAD-binding protein
MRIAIIGGGISGLVSAWLLADDHDITLFDANDYVGGHTNTVDLEIQGKPYAVDTGFIVFNETTYPGFCTILRRLGVLSQPSPMTFSMKCELTSLEYSPHSFRTFFAQHRNIISPAFYRMIADIIRFRRDLDRLIRDEHAEQGLGAYLHRHGYSRLFIEKFVFALGSSLWSTDPERVNEFPLKSFARFFKNHGFLEARHSINWRVIQGGSKRYVEKLTLPYRNRIRLNTPVLGVSRRSDEVELELPGGRTECFDHIVIATHSDQALAMLRDPSTVEREILTAIPYQESSAILHTDTSVLPKRRSIWSSWNYLIPREKIGRAALTYDMNILQTLQAPVEFCVTLNREAAIDANAILGRFTYHHPLYTPRAPAAQMRHAEISGVRRTHYCGAYWGYGFHEDGVQSALAACKYFGKGL